jgi:decaprenyl-phosphate phosphoribosyltransferase
MAPGDERPHLAGSAGAARMPAATHRARRQRPMGLELLSSMRPRQWAKNLLVFAAPAAAAVLPNAGVFGRTIAAFFVFVGASAATYLVNDVIDRKNDALHPVKRHRPIASGRVPVPLALGTAAVLATASLADAAVVALPLAGVVAAYLAISFAYSLFLKHVPIVELACVASGFALRAVAGGAAAHVPISPWFLVMTSFGALLIVAGKRSTEQQVLGKQQGHHRIALTAYPPDFLRSVRRLSMAVAVMTYCLWAFERASHLHAAGRHANLVWFELSVVPFVLAVLAVELAIMKGRGGEPEELAMSDRLLQILGLVWLGLVLVGIYW